MTIDELRETIAVLTNIPENTQKLHIHTTIVHPGQYSNKSQMKLSCLNLADRIKVFVVPVNPVESLPRRPVSRAHTHGGKKRDTMNDFLDKGFQKILLESLGNSPEELVSKLQSSQIGKRLARNPQFSRLLENPNMMKDMLRSVVDPDARSDTMRNFELRIQQISNMGGESMLRNIYEDYLKESDNESECVSQSDSDSESGCDDERIFDHRKTVEPLPNPWESQMQTTSFAPDFFQFPNSRLSNGVSKQQSQFPIKSNPKEDFSSQLQELRSMGFQNEAENIAALQRSKGDVNLAVVILLSS
eukprot:CAMPEP_0201529682 /NCGR_PEP_ID=MMETSP0161_2-20130828/42515_1 /ASSEMBLY_ACC=CAM_ASM_000251 /TAXON_ID=180227 /ORGANISM="Neoparamoeba aestuarina, Strain SoJaBio B1-5/56/2" /LENGTH=301 /DNA_ID=CAMNT_0047931619 /DNA_START=80 /DNA_END=981 /DNA_ORIENTATION=-